MAGIRFRIKKLPKMCSITLSDKVINGDRKVLNDSEGINRRVPVLIVAYE